MLDTNCLTLLLYGEEAICRHAALHPPNELALTIVTVEETLTGWYTQLRRAKKEDTMIDRYLRREVKRR